MASAAVLVPVPGEVALAFTAEQGWHLIPPAPSWWLDEQEQLLEQDAGAWALRCARPTSTTSTSTNGPLYPVTVLADVRAVSRAQTACRPGAGPCRRRHEHASQRRAAG